jgi:hypothetical protein
MALSDPPFIVLLETPLGTPFGKTMHEIRSWLDHRKIHPADFRPSITHVGAGFKISFRSEGEAELFRQEFMQAPNKLGS